MIAAIREAVQSHPVFRRLLADAVALGPGQVQVVAGLAGSLDAAVYAALAQQTGRQLVLVLTDAADAARMRDDITLWLPPARVHVFIAPMHQHAADIRHDTGDVEALRAMVTERPDVVVTCSHSLRRLLPSPESIRQSCFTLQANAPASPGEVVARLDQLGFERTEFVQACGEYALRGGILDIYPYVGENPVRVEFAGDAIESIREFDPVSQRSIRELTLAAVVPDLLSAAHTASAGERAGILDYADRSAIVVVDNPDVALPEAILPDAESGPRLHPEEVTGALRRFPQIHRSVLRDASPGTMDFEATPQPAVNGSIAVLRRSLQELHTRGFSTVILCDTPQELLRLKELLEQTPDDGIDAAADGRGSVSVSPTFSHNALHQGFLLPGASLAVYTEHQIFNRLKRRGMRRRPRFRGFSQQDIQLLHRGDYVVHEDYGIGRFDGLRRIQVRGVDQEVVRVLYDGSDILYVNLNYVTKLQKYSSKEGHIPKLTKLGSPDWERLKARAKKKVKDIARELIALYAKRKAMPGYAFPQDTPWQKELEASFLYEDTFDQAKATLDVKRDMEAPSPMDRLVCGDVGFGKTEVAVRAAFKAVLAGRQAAVLVPTTILAHQHENTFRDRVSRYGVRVKVLSRFTPRKELVRTLDELAAGGVDIVIGTHRLLSRDVVFKNLGLVVIDEEHRFGVTAKERLRQLRAEVDTLALTATPIPRTLHFSLMGARDLSVIATPPRNRLPIVTELTQWKDETVRDAVIHEVQRAGQVYVVHDRVHTIDEMAERLRAIVPSVRIRVAHGQMHAHELEQVMVEFLEKQVDVLVSTKIIESGLDIPNVNTIIINRADRFGMAELYQLRGRVGRSNLQAYAYLLIPPVSVLPRSTVQRLQAVEEFTELGSGFNLAMRDLEIRGAGNLLGSEQSGFIETMGFETYTRVLEEAVRELKEQEFQELLGQEGGQAARRPTTVVEPEFDALLPATYVRDDVERLALYRRLYALESASQLAEVSDELRDRFGVLPHEVTNLFRAIEIRLAAARRGFARVGISAERLEIDLPPESDTAFYESNLFQELMTAVALMQQEGVVLKQEGKILRLTLPLSNITGDDHPLGVALLLIERLPGG